MQASVSPMLTTDDLACERGGRLLFRKLSLDLASGDALHVTGANGSGKTTLIRALAGLLTPYSGSVERDGTMGLLDERCAIDPELPLGKALGFWQRVDGCSDPSRALCALGLEPLLDVPVRYLSTGQRKRAGMAMLLNSGAQIWLLDEPLSGLDASAIERVNALIQTHLSGGGIAVVASHQPFSVNGLQSLAIEDFAPPVESGEQTA